MTTLDAARVREHLFSLNTRGIKYDLDRMREAVRRCGDPQLAYPCFHVAGTNGKGSVCAYIDSVLRSTGRNVGLYTSPHLIHFEERFVINGQMIIEREWLDVYASLQRIIDELSLTFFEASTLIAFELFRRRNVDWAVFEVGLGGRLDATNVVRPRVSVIARLALDHAEYLGSDIISVAREKLGIVKNGVPLVMAEPSEQAVRDCALSTCSERETTCRFVPFDPTQLIEDLGPRGLRFTFDLNEYSTPLPGIYQLQNASVALAALNAAGFTDHKALRKGLLAARLPARFQVIVSHEKIVILDVGHNPDAAGMLASTVQALYGTKKTLVVTGIMKDKDTAGVLAQYCRFSSALILTRPSLVRAEDPAALAGNIPDSYRGTVEIIEDVGAATMHALTTDAEVVCIAGSFHTVGEAMLALEMDTQCDATR